MSFQSCKFRALAAEGDGLTARSAFVILLSVARAYASLLAYFEAFWLVCFLWL